MNDQRRPIDFMDSLTSGFMDLSLMDAVPGRDDEAITYTYQELYGEFHMTKALRWFELRKSGHSAEEAYQQVQREFPPTPTA